MVQYNIYKIVMLYLLKVYPTLCRSAENLGTLLTIFGTFSQNRQKSIEIDEKTTILFTVTRIISASHTGVTSNNLVYVQNQFYWL